MKGRPIAPPRRTTQSREAAKPRYQRSFRVGSEGVEPFLGLAAQVALREALDVRVEQAPLVIGRAAFVREVRGLEQRGFVPDRFEPVLRLFGVVSDVALCIRALGVDAVGRRELAGEDAVEDLPCAGD